MEILDQAPDRPGNLIKLIDKLLNN